MGGSHEANAELTRRNLKLRRQEITLDEVRRFNLRSFEVVDKVRNFKLRRHYTSK